MALVTDYDCWHPSHDSVTAEQVMANLVAERGHGQGRAALRGPAGGRARRDRECTDALRHALMTSADLVPAEVKRDLAPILAQYMR